MVSKKILGLAIAAAFASQGAFAVLPLDLDATATVQATNALSYATESVYTVASGYAAITTTGASAIDVVGKVKSGVTANNQIYIRYDLTNAKFATAVAPADLTFAAGTATAPVQAPLVAIQSGGGVGSSFVIFQVTAQANAADRIDQDNLAHLALTTLSVSTSGNASVQYAAYDSAGSAVNQVAVPNRLALSSYANAVKWVSAFTPVYSATSAVASVVNSFTDFVTSGATAKIGTVQLKLDTTARKSDSSNVAILGDVLVPATSKIKLAGDISFGAWGLGTPAATSALAGCGVGPAIPFVDDAAITGTALDTLLVSDATVNNAANVNKFFAVCVDDTAANAINAGDYSLAVNPVGLTGALVPPAATSGALGSITRDGTSVYVPYLTTFADYNNRIVLVNRGASAAPYKITFTTESGVTATAGAAATGTLAAKQTLVLKATDVVTLAGGTRTAATIVVTAQPANIDAATTSVNLSDKSTDTVKLK